MIADPITSSRINQVREEARYEKWVHWPVNWSAVFVGAFAALASILIIGLIGLALGAHLVGSENRVVDLKKLSIGTLIFSIAGAFFSFVIGGWVAGRVAGILRSEPGILHGAIVWLVSIPILVVLTGIGAGSLFGGWYAGLSASSHSAPAVYPFEKPEPLDSSAGSDERNQYRVAMNDYREKVKQWNTDTPRVTRNTALGAVTALLLGLIGGVIGGWMASGEPMNFTHHRTRRALANQRATV